MASSQVKSNWKRDERDTRSIYLTHANRMAKSSQVKLEERLAELVDVGIEGLHTNYNEMGVTTISTTYS